VNARCGVDHGMKTSMVSGTVFTPGVMRRQIRIHMVAGDSWMGRGGILPSLPLKNRKSSTRCARKKGKGGVFYA